jgi:hypothetical protein
MASPTICQRLQDILLATRIVSTMPPEKAEDGHEYFRCYIADQAEVVSLYAWAISRFSTAEVVG